jgi:hypothetical protein
MSVCGDGSVVLPLPPKLKPAESRPASAKMIYLNHTLALELVALVKKLMMTDGKTMFDGLVIYDAGLDACQVYGSLLIGVTTYNNDGYQHDGYSHP